MTTRRIRSIRRTKKISRQRHNILSRTPVNIAEPQEKYSYIIAQFRQWLQQADGALLLADDFINQYVKEHVGCGSSGLSDENKKEIEEYAHNHVREVMEKAFAD